MRTGHWNRQLVKRFGDWLLDEITPREVSRWRSQMQTKVVDPKIVELAAQLGHSPTETLKTYGHVFSEYRRQPRVPAIQLIAEARGGEVGWVAAA